MACYAPWQRLGADGVKRPVACGQCIGCRLEYSRQWAVRIMHEAKLHEDNAFVTLTYKEIPPEAYCVRCKQVIVHGSLHYCDYQLFMRGLRRVYRGVRFFVGGEYGEGFGRPHYHACLFGVKFSDSVYAGKSPAGVRLFRSEQLSDLWGRGFCSVGSLTFESAGYVARYCMKKVTGDHADAHYGGRVPEFCRMSLKPGIGAGWFERFGESDVAPSGRVLVNGKEANAPRYYVKLMERSARVAACFGDKSELHRLEAVKAARLEAGLSKASESSPSRLRAREAVQSARMGLLKRKL